MNRLGKIALWTLVCCSLVLLLGWSGRLAYLASAEQKERTQDLEAKVQTLQRTAHSEWRVRTAKFKISTSDKPGETMWRDLRLVYGTNAVQKFDDNIGKEPGEIVTAWISNWTPRSEIAKFEQLTVSRLQGSRFEIAAQILTNESVSMEFTVTFIVE